MSDLFREKAEDWDSRDMVQQLSRGIGSTILDRVELRDDMQVMDFGAGTGLISSHVAPHVARITAVDISQAMLDKLAEKQELQGKVETLCQDILQQPLQRRFDLIMSAMAMHHVEDTEALIRTLNEHLQHNGMLALADLDSEDGLFHPEDVEGVYHHGFDREALGELLRQQGFNQVEFTTAHTVNKEGRLYPVFLLLAKRNQ